MESGCKGWKWADSGSWDVVTAGLCQSGVEIEERASVFQLLSGQRRVQGALEAAHPRHPKESNFRVSGAGLAAME
jgi:hypothetical protein